MQLNHNVIPFLFEHLQIHNEYELFDLLQLELLVITKGKKGATFLFKEHNQFTKLDIEPETVVNVTDSSGAGDAFFATILREYAYCKKLDSDFIYHIFTLANSASKEVI